MFCTIHRYSLHAKIFSRLDLNQEEEVLMDSSESRPWEKIHPVLSAPLSLC